MLSLAYQSAGGWGKAIFETTGHLPPGTVVALGEHNRAHRPAPGFFPISYTIPGKDKARHVGMQIIDAQGRPCAGCSATPDAPPGKQDGAVERAGQ